MMIGGALCNDATLEDAPEIGQIDAEKTYRAVGDPTAGALVIASARQGSPKPALEARLPRVDELPFDSDPKHMTTVHQLRQPLNEEHKLPQLDASFTTLEYAFHPHRNGEGYIAFTKGAVDSLLDVAGAVWVGDKKVPLNEEWRARIGDANTELAKEGLRVLGVAFRPLDRRTRTDELEDQLTFVGIGTLPATIDGLFVRCATVADLPAIGAPARRRRARQLGRACGSPASRGLSARFRGDR